MDMKDRHRKRCFDLFVSCFVLMLCFPALGILILLCRFDTGQTGIFRQTRLGQNGKRFTLYKLRTMRSEAGSHVTTQNDSRITKLGRVLRRYKLDELPQLWNVLKGDMSLVGPRPDLPGYLDQLKGPDRRLMTLRPGITGPASLKYREEESLLASVDNPVAFNDIIIWPDKVRLNLAYLDNWSFVGDLKILRQTILP